MSELHVVAVLPAKAGSEDVVRQAMTALVEPTLGEEGCLTYELFESAAAPGTFITVETWRGQDDLDAHLQTPHVAAALEVAAEHLDGPPAIHPLNPIPA